MSPTDVVRAEQAATGTRSLVLQYGWLLASRLTSVALQAVTLVLLARWVGPSSFGVAAAVMGVLTVAGALADLGLGPLLLRQRSADRSYRRTTQILRTNAATSVGLAVLAVAVLGVLGTTTGSSALHGLIPLAIWVAAEKNGDLWLNLATSEGRTQVSALSILLRRGLGLGLFVSLSVVLPTLWAFSTGLAVGSIVANLVIRRLLVHARTDAPSTEIIQLVREAWPFYLNSVAAQARNLDVMIVSGVAGPVAAGVYAVPARMTSPLRLLPTSLSPIIVRYAALGTPSALRAIRHVSIIVMVVMPAVMLAVAVAAPWLIDVSLGAQFSSAVLPLRIICGGLVFAFAVSLQTSYLQGRGEEQYVGKVAVVITVLTLSSLALGAILGGSTGAAYAASGTFLVHCIMLAGRTRQLRRPSEEPSR